MDFSRPARPRPARENIVPMINVVFLLLIFFLMTAQIAPPDPFEITPPASDTDGTPAETPAALFVAADGRLAYGAARDAAVFDALAAAPPPGPLLLRADTGFDASDLPALLARLHAAGVTDIALITQGEG